MAFDFGRLFPEAAKKKREEAYENLLYVVLVEWKWDYNTFLNTPYPVINSCFKVWNRVKKEERKANKRK